MDLRTFHIELIENYPCECKEELVAREGYWIRQIGTLNAAVAGRTSKEWREEHRDYLKQRARTYYYNKHEDELKKRKEWRDNNKDKKHEQDRRYRENNNYKIICDKCGCLIQKKGMANHQKTNKCKLITESKNTQILS